VTTSALLAPVIQPPAPGSPAAEADAAPREGHAAPSAPGELSANSQVSAVILGENDTQDAVTFLGLYYPAGGLIRMHKVFYEWRAGKYCVLSDEEMESRITFRCGHLPQRKIKGILSAVKSYTQVYGLPKVMPPQFELTEGPGRRKEYLRPAPNLIAFRNGVLDVTEWLANSRNVVLHRNTPNLFCQSVLPYDYDPSAAAPSFRKFIHEALPDADQQRLALKMMGASLLAENRFQVIFVLCGAPGSGKSTFAKVMSGLVGEDSLASATMQSVQGEFGTFPLLSARLILMPEANSSEGHGKAITDKIKAWSGGDQIPVRKIYGDGFTAQMPGRILLVANELPTFPDPSGAILRRLTALHFRVSFVGAEDRDLSSKIEAEMAGVMNEALRGLRTLLQEDQGFGQKTVAESALLDEYRDEVMPVLAFMKECCMRAPGGRVSARDLFQTYRRWSEDTGRKFSCQQTTFSRRIEPALRSLGIPAEKTRTGAGTAWTGLSWSEHGARFAPAGSI
jgi:P4 family phage/plasmid primase-like protien